MNEAQNNRSQGGAAPFGYRWHAGRLEVDQTEAPVRRLIFDLFLKHRRKKTVARLLNELGYRTRKGAHFSDVAIDRLLRDTTANGFRRELGVDVPVDPIVSPDVWKRANRLLSKREIRRPVNLFAGRVKCSCGGTMNVPSNSNKLVCPQCRAKIPTDDLEAIFASQLEPFWIGPQNLGELWSDIDATVKGLIVEQLCENIVVARESISTRFACDPYLLKTSTFDQRSEPVNGSPHINDIDAVDSTEVVEPLLSEVEAAGFLGISKMTLLRKRNAGLIGFFQVGIRILYSKEKHLLPYLADCEVRRQRPRTQR